MKKQLSMFIVAILLLLSACSTTPAISTVPAESTIPPESTAPAESSAPAASSTTDPIEQALLPLPQDNTEFSFLSGAGAWRTILTLNRDGTFTGWYLDSEMGEIGTGYPDGSAYTCTFSGAFANMEPINEFSYKMTLVDVKTEKAVGEEWIEDKIRYVASEPYGLNDPLNGQECTDFILYLPDTPVDQVPEEFLSWWPYRHAPETERKAKLSCYGILNVTTEYGFFTEG